MKKKILIVEDDTGVLDVLRIILERAGFQVSVLTRGESILQDDFEHPDLILLDKQLSGVDGLDICRHLKTRAATKHIPIIMTSATPDVARLAIEAQADDFIEKPFNNTEVVGRIRHFVK